MTTKTVSVEVDIGVGRRCGPCPFQTPNSFYGQTGGWCLKFQQPIPCEGKMQWYIRCPKCVYVYGVDVDLGKKCQED